MSTNVTRWTSHTSKIYLILIKFFYSQYGTSPLQAAIERGHTGTAELLIDKGADVNKCDKVTV